MRRLLIANRGEIAIRVARTARRMGIATVAVYSDADAGMPHVAACDSAVRIGPAPSRDSYLNIGAVIDAARQSGADAVHPGYGFLSENAAFARAVLDAGLTFVGPRPETIETMGDKARAREIAAQLGVPVLGGHEVDPGSDARATADRLGYPLIVKALAGGGGRGMRVVRSSAGLAEALAGAAREAEAAFGDGRLLLERLVEDARHVEVQVFGDAHGNVVHLFERDCSAQRRHQKVVEEAPSPAVSQTLRDRLTGDALKLARSVGYIGAGTVEFVVGGGGEHHFLEMNTRLQVEHPVTEAITGLDLVEWQLRVARGERLPLAQDGITMRGHAIEARLCAEDPAIGFLPQTGRIVGWSPPPDARIDAGVETGSVISPHYDSMIAKIVVHGADRLEAVDRLVAALDATRVAGVITNRTFLRRLVDGSEFRDGAVTTPLIDAWVGSAGAGKVAPALAAPKPSPEVVALAAAILGRADGDWFRSTGVADCPIDLEGAGERHSCRLLFERGTLAGIDVDGGRADLDAIHIGPGSVEYVRSNVSRHAHYTLAGGELWLDVAGETYRFAETDHRTGGSERHDGQIVAPLSGLVRQVLVAVGDDVAAGAPVLIIEAMKMETRLTARVAGTVRAIHVLEGRQASARAVLIEIEPAA